MKIRIFTLAKELGMDSKVLIGVCQKIGIHLKDSPLASISEEEKERVLASIKHDASSGESAAKSEAVVPKRETPRSATSTKVPAIRARAQPARDLGKIDDLDASSQDLPATDESDALSTMPEPASTAEASFAAPTTAAPGDSDDLAEVSGIGASGIGVSGLGASGIVEESSARGTMKAPHSAHAPLRREDYQPASGSMRTMTPRGNMPQIAPPSARKSKARPTPQLPKLAEPPPSPKAPSAGAGAPGDVPAQKPEMRLNAEALQGKPLHEHIRQHAEDKKRKASGDEPADDFVEETKRPGVKAGPGARAATGMGLLSERKQRQAKRTRGPGMLAEDDELETKSGDRLRQHRNRARRGGSIAPQKTSAEIKVPVAIRDLCAAMGKTSRELMGILARQGRMVTINSSLDEETALDLAMECGIDLQIVRERDIEAEMSEAADSSATTGQRVPRPPIITILGHVDHGKTTLLDKIRSANVAAGEVGGITQHIAAYQVEHRGRRITFLDTPGHAAFGEMRARGANVTDVAVLVVAANDGVMPQTIEALNHARAAGVPIVVALNKVDLPDRNEQRVLQDLAGQNLLAAEWGGDTEVVRTSGATGAGIEDLLETLLTVAELKELTADPEAVAHGVCLEAFRDEGRGPVAWLIVQDGSVKKGDVVLCGPAYGRIRSMYDDHDHEIDIAGPSVPVKVAGLDIIPGAGDRFFVARNPEEARQAALLRRERGRELQLAQRGKVRTLQEILSTKETGDVQDLPVILKADTPGSLEALKGEILKFQHAEVRVVVLHEGVGGVNESDVYLASAAGAIIVAFHVVPEDRAEVLAEREGVEIRKYGIIYEVTDDIKKALEGLLRPEVVETDTGRAVVLQTFDISRFGRIAGCRVLKGVIERTNRIKLIRDQRILNTYGIASLKRNKDDAREVRDGLECGIRLEGFDDVKEGDVFQAFKIEEIKRTL
ncbi:MAG: translation initiation factor IF-2 [Planctomycetaceae bacterium]|nr:translation initiation factor IF-2 [Planctomycetaceae bacterium]